MMSLLYFICQYVIKTPWGRVQWQWLTPPAQCHALYRPTVWQDCGTGRTDCTPQASQSDHLATTINTGWDCWCDPRMSERSETESERDLDNIEVISEPEGSSKRSSLRSGAGAGGGAGASLDRNDSSPPPHQVRPYPSLSSCCFLN